jgi:hypothetical protein
VPVWTRSCLSRVSASRCRLRPPHNASALGGAPKFCCKAVRSERPTDLGCDPAPSDSGRAPVHRRLSALPWRSWTFSRSATLSRAKCRGAVAPASQAAPSLRASVDSQIVRRQRVSPAAMAWDIRSPSFAVINIGEVDGRRTISTNHAPATKITRLNSITYKRRLATADFAGESAAPSVEHSEGLFGS